MRKHGLIVMAFLLTAALPTLAQTPACSVMVYPRFVVPNAATGTPGRGSPLAVFVKLMPAAASLPDTYAVKFRGGDGLSRGLTWLPVGDFNPANGDTGNWFADGAAWATGTRQFYFTDINPKYFWIHGKVLNTSTAGLDTFRVRARLLVGAGTNYDSPVYEVRALDTLTNGGWIAGNVYSNPGLSVPHVRRIILTFKADTIASIYMTENNKIREGYDSTNAGYFRMAVPAGNIDSLQVRDTLNNVLASYAGTAPPWTINPNQTTSINANVPPVITMITQPADTYDGTGPFLVRAVITDPAKTSTMLSPKTGIAADTLYYTAGGDWATVLHSSVNGDTFSYSIPGPIPTGTVVEYYIGAYDDAGAATWEPNQFAGHLFRILNPLPPAGLTANAGDMLVQLGWAPPAEELAYDNGSPVFAWGTAPGVIYSTRFTPQHYPCRIEQAVSAWYDGGSGNDSIEVHVWPDDGTGIPDVMTDLVPPFKILPDLFTDWNIVDLSGYNVILSSGDFHIGYICQDNNRPMAMSDNDGPGIRTVVFDGSSWGNLVLGDNYYDFNNRAAVTYSSYTKGLALKSYRPRRSDKPLPRLAGLKATPITSKQSPVYARLTGALAMAKNINRYTVSRSVVSGGPYAPFAFVTNTSVIDASVQNGTQYYYVVRADYVTPDTFSAYSSEASATPAALPILLVDDDGSDVEGNPDVRAAYTAALDAAGQAGNYAVFNATSNGAGPDSNWLRNRTHVIWFTGLSGDGSDTTLTPTNETMLATYLDNGGRLFLCGDDYTYQVYNGYYKFSPGEFPYDYLGVDSTSDIGPNVPFNIAGMPFALSDGQTFTVNTLPVYLYWDDMVKTPAASYVFDVTAKVGEKVGVQYSNGTFRTVFFAFPFENITDGTSPNTKGELMARILSWLTTGVEGRPTTDLSKPAVYSLAANYPNPVRGQTTVKFGLPKAGRVSIGVYNVMGQKVKTLVDGAMNAGYHTVNWNGRNESGQAVSAGVYLYRMQADNFSSVRKLVVVR